MGTEFPETMSQRSSVFEGDSLGDSGATPDPSSVHQFSHVSIDLLLPHLNFELGNPPLGHPQRQGPPFAHVKPSVGIKLSHHLVWLDLWHLLMVLGSLSLGRRGMRVSDATPLLQLRIVRMLRVASVLVWFEVDPSRFMGGEMLPVVQSLIRRGSQVEPPH
jgi:hypothetical protein